MPRRQRVRRPRRAGDARYNNTTVGTFINSMMLRGKRGKSAAILYEAMDTLEQKAGKDALEVFLQAIANVRPVLEVKSRRVGGSTYQVPIEVRDSRQLALAIRWIIQYARERRGHSMAESLGMELLDAFNETGNSVKKKEDTHRMAEANKAFAHYRW